jgi:hypothetical protein
MSDSIRIGDRVRIFLDSRKFRSEGWYEGTVVRIDPYSEHRRFYWVALAQEARELLGIQEISVFNPKNIQKLE